MMHVHMEAGAPSQHGAMGLALSASPCLRHSTWLSLWCVFVFRLHLDQRNLAWQGYQNYTLTFLFTLVYIVYTIVKL